METAGDGRWRVPDGHMICLVLNTMESIRMRQSVTELSCIADLGVSYAH
jgi:hypothetical protein